MQLPSTIGRFVKFLLTLLLFGLFDRIHLVGKNPGFQRAYKEPIQATPSYQIVPKAAERELFRRLTYTEFCILTTLDIQLRYSVACRLRKRDPGRILICIENATVPNAEFIGHELRKLLKCSLVNSQSTEILAWRYLHL